MWLRLKLFEERQFVGADPEAPLNPVDEGRQTISFHDFVKRLSPTISITNIMSRNPPAT